MQWLIRIYSQFSAVTISAMGLILARTNRSCLWYTGYTAIQDF